MTKHQSKDNVKNIRQILSVLGDHIDNLTPRNTPTKEHVSAARATASTINTYVGILRVSMEYSRMRGVTPDLGFLQIGPVKNNSTRRIKNT